MSLSRNEHFFGGGQGTGDTYCLISTIHTLAALQIVAMNVGINYVSVYEATPDGGFVCSILMGVGSGRMCIHLRFDLGAESQCSSNRRAGAAEHTLKTPTIPSKSSFQAEIASLSSFAW